MQILATPHAGETPFPNVEYVSMGGGSGQMWDYNYTSAGGAGRWQHGTAQLIKGIAYHVLVGAGSWQFGQQSDFAGHPTPTFIAWTNNGYMTQGYGGYWAISDHTGGGGGAGAGGNGVNSPGRFNPNPSIQSNQPGNGGPGRATDITGATLTMGGGGGGQGHRNAGGITRALGGSGGGGAGELYINGCVHNGENGAVNTGGGGGGFHECAAYISGGSGRVIMAYLSTQGALSAISAGLTYTLSTSSRSGYHVYSFTSGEGTITP